MKNIFAYLCGVFIVLSVIAIVFHQMEVCVFTVCFTALTAWWQIESRIEARDRQVRVFINRDTAWNAAGDDVRGAAWRAAKSSVVE